MGTLSYAIDKHIITFRHKHMSTNTQVIVDKIHYVERTRLFNCLNCRQAIHILQDMAPLLCALKEMDADLYRTESGRLANAQISFMASYIKTQLIRFEPNCDVEDLGFSEIQIQMTNVCALITEIFRLELTDHQRETLEQYSKFVTEMHESAKAYGKQALRLARRERFWYYFDGPGRTLLIVVGTILLISILI